MTTTERATSAQLRRAAGSNSLENLKQALEGWSVEEIDDMASGKNAVHMAAWQGCIDNLEYLLDMGCDINVKATGEYSYGKTPIFFAATRSRDEVVDYLIERGANVKIVNNKGQSVLSIASSHLRDTVIARIQQKEKEQPQEWLNYRATHSDGLEYGDLDPRFLERPLRQSDTVTPLAINPTTKESRRGSFLRRNPHLTSNSRREKKQPRRKKKKERSPSLSEEDYQRLEQAWDRLEKGMANNSPESEDLLTIIRISENRRCAWITELADRLRKHADCLYLQQFCLSVSGSSERETALLAKLLMQISYPVTNHASEQVCSPSPLVSSRRQTIPSLELGHWREACQAVQGMDMSTFERDFPILVLPSPPLLVDTIDDLLDLEEAVQAQSVVAIDSEWYDDHHGVTLAATLQVAVREKHSVRAWVIDLIQGDERYQPECQAFVKHLFGEKILLGFAVGHDIPKLEMWMNDSLPRQKLLDMQLLWSGGEMPGLAACVRCFSSIPLSKEQQCSDWRRRPLTNEQLSYAGLDAAVLLPLLAERRGCK